MGPSTDALISSTVAGSALLSKYGTAVDNVSAYEKIAGKAAPSTGPAAGGARPGSGGVVQGGVQGGTTDQNAIDAEARRIEEEILGRPSSRPAPADQPDYREAPGRDAPERQAPRQAPRSPDRRSPGAAASAMTSPAPWAPAFRAWPARWVRNSAGNCSAESLARPRNAAAARTADAGGRRRRAVRPICPGAVPCLATCTSGGGAPRHRRRPRHGDSCGVQVT